MKIKNLKKWKKKEFWTLRNWTRLKPNQKCPVTFITWETFQFAWQKFGKSKNRKVWETLGSNQKNFEHFIIGPVQSQIEKCPVSLTISETFQFAWKKWKIMYLENLEIYKHKNPEKWKKVFSQSVGNWNRDTLMADSTKIEKQKTTFSMVSKTFF